MDSASSGTFFPEECGSIAEGKPDPNKDHVEINSISNDEQVHDTADNVEESDARSITTETIGELKNIKLVQSEVVVGEQVCCCYGINVTRMDEITNASIYDEDDGSLQVFEEGNDENPKVKEGIDEDPNVEVSYDESSC